MRNTFLLLFLLLAAGGYSAFGQGQEDRQGTLLPEIDPQEIEIPSEYRARFPGLRRQPILGFNPTPRVYQIDPDRQPFMETQEQIVANLPVSDLARPQAPDYVPLRYASSMSGYGRIGAGSFFSPEARFWGGIDITPNSYLGGSLNYHSTDGHLDDQESSFQFLNASADYITRFGEGTVLRIDGRVNSDFNHLYSLGDAADNFWQIARTPRKDYSGMGASAELQRMSNSIEGWKGEAFIRSSGVDLSAGDLSGRSQEAVYGGRFKMQWAGSNINEMMGLNAGIEAGQYDVDGAGVQNWSTFSGGGSYQRLYDYSTKLTVKAKAYYITNDVESKFYLGPVAEVQHWLSDRLDVTGELSGKPYIFAAQRHHETNRFLHPEITLRHTYSIDARARVRFEYFRGSTVQGGIAFTGARNYPYYRRNIREYVNEFAVPDNTQAFYSVAYSDATNLRVFGGMTHQFVPDKVWLDAEAYIQNPKLEGDDDIPFEERWGLKASAGWRPIRQLTLTAWADYTGTRNAFDIGGNLQKLDGFFVTGGRVEADITGMFGAYAKFVNLLGETYEVWPGYEERPLQIYGGLTLKLK